MKQKYLLATDLDGTLVGDTRAKNQLFQYFKQHETAIQLVYITRRQVESAQQLIKKENLPLPDVLICDVGSSIYVPLRQNQLVEDYEWANKTQENWFPQEIIDIVEEQSLQLQCNIPHAKRISIMISDECELKNICQQLTQTNLTYQFIYSSGKYLDILPQNSGKANALSFVLKKYYENEYNVLVAGGSANDLEMLAIGYPSVIVGNAEKELQTIKNTPVLYKAKGHYAEGIKEAWDFFY